MSTLKPSREVGTVAVRLDKRTSVQLITSYSPPAGSSSQPDQEIEIPLPTDPCTVWLSAATVIGCQVDAADWPAWTDEVRFGAGRGEGGAR